jgi:hypothetical protein
MIKDFKGSIVEPEPALLEQFQWVELPMAEPELQ